MKQFLFTVTVIISCFVLMFATTLFLELNFFKKEFSRELLVYVLMGIELFVGVRLVIVLNK